MNTLIKEGYLVKIGTARFISGGRENTRTLYESIGTGKTYVRYKKRICELTPYSEGCQEAYARENNESSVIIGKIE